MSFSAPGPFYRVFFRPYGKMYKTIGYPGIRRAVRMLEGCFARVLATEADTLARSEKLCEIEAKRAALVRLLGTH